MRNTKHNVRMNVFAMKEMGLDVSLDSNANGLRMENGDGSAYLSDRMNTVEASWFTRGVIRGVQLERERIRKGDGL